MSSNARCLVCGEAVYFYANSHGSRVYFDFPGPPWPKHGCTDRAIVTSDYLHKIHLDEINRQYAKRPEKLRSMDKDGWKLFRVLRSRSFRLEIEHRASGLRYETNLLKDSLPALNSALWLRLANHSVEISFFNMDRFREATHLVAKFEARKFATMQDWVPFDIWFSGL